MHTSLVACLGLSVDIVNNNMKWLLPLRFMVTNKGQYSNWKNEINGRMN